MTRWLVSIVIIAGVVAISLTLGQRETQEQQIAPVNEPVNEPAPWLVEGPIAVGKQVRIRVERLPSADPMQPTVLMFWIDDDCDDRVRLTIKDGQATIERWSDEEEGQ